MNPTARRRCLHCRQAFLPDYRNVYHQRFCSDPGCRQASKRASQRRWLRKPGNRNYFREPDNLLRVRQWRQLHPGYWRFGRQRCEAATDLELAKEAANGSMLQAGTLQDFCRCKASVLAELISQLSRCALQEDIACCASQMLSEAQCILVRCQLSVSAPTQAGGPVNYHESG
jgi:hypothetical protein